MYLFVYYSCPRREVGKQVHYKHLSRGRFRVVSWRGEGVGRPKLIEKRLLLQDFGQF